MSATDRRRLAERVGVPRNRAVGGWLKRLRREAGLTVREAAERVGWNASGVSFIEVAERTPLVEDVAALLTVYGVVDERRRLIVDMAKSMVDKACWWTSAAAGLQPEIAASMHERCASRITDWSPSLIPALLQTSDYARAVSAVDDHETQQIEELVAARGERAEAVKRVPYVGFLGEEALNTPVGGPVVHGRQLRHLADIARRGMVRVVRRCIPHPGLRGPWTTLHYADGNTIRVDLLGSTVYLTGAAAKPYSEAQNRLMDVALSPEHSCALIEAMVKRPVGAFAG
jgi:transcriptional regulator with XRE-family HTH domain